MALSLMEIDNSNKLEEIINYLILNQNICFKNQSRDESDLNDTEKSQIARDIFTKSKSNFLGRFGKFLKFEHFDFIKTVTQSEEEIMEVTTIISNLIRFKENDCKLKTKNRRYEALNKLIKENTYFSENEMMKRNPLLYEQLVGRYLTESEKRERDKNIEKDTLVKILLEKMERDLAEEKLNQQLEEESIENGEFLKSNQEDEMEKLSGEVEINEDESLKAFKWGEFPSATNQNCYTSKWGEIPQVGEVPSTSKCVKPKKERIKKSITKRKNQNDNHLITAEERRLLKEEFISIMHQNFLNGKDDFDYSTVDNNDEYDNIDILEHDEEEKYFDSEEPDDIKMDDEGEKIEEKLEEVETSEDELDIYMNALNQHPSVVQLSKELEKM